MLQHPTDQEGKVLCDVFRNLEKNEPFRAKIVFGEEIAFHLSGEPKDIALQFAGAKAA